MDQAHGLGLRLGAAVALFLGGCTYPVELVPESTAQVDLDSPVEPGDPGAAEVVVEVKSSLNRHAISPLIYGIRKGDFALNRHSLFSTAQLRWSTYNWENNASNAGYTLNFNSGDLAGPSNSDIAGQGVELQMSEALTAGASVLLVVPIGARVAADKINDGDVSASPDYLTTRFKNSWPKKDGPFSLNPDPNDPNVYQDEFVNWVKTRFPTAHVLFAMDEEPDLWSKVMRVARPVPQEILTWKELVDRNVQYADAVKRIWPDASVVGLTSYGWSGFTRLEYYDGVNEGQLPADAGTGHFLDFYLSSLNGDQASRGRRLVDYVDLHWNSEAKGDGIRVTDDKQGRGAIGAEARVQAPRSLWDSSYVESSWITEVVTINTGIQLIPRIEDKIKRLYPGTKLAFGAWRFGGNDHISGAIAVADTLGIFGRYEIVGMAAMGTAEGSYLLPGFRIYTNYDGAGARFGDTSIDAQTSDVAAVTAYASVDSAQPTRVVMVLINKRSVATTVGIKLAHPTVYQSADVYELGPGGPTIAHRGMLPAAGVNAFSYTMAPLTIGVVLPQR